LSHNYIRVFLAAVTQHIWYLFTLAVEMGMSDDVRFVLYILYFCWYLIDILSLHEDQNEIRAEGESSLCCGDGASSVRLDIGSLCFYFGLYTSYVRHIW